jgi:hypothetical protein
MNCEVLRFFYFPVVKELEFHQQFCSTEKEYKNFIVFNRLVYHTEYQPQHISQNPRPVYFCDFAVFYVLTVFCEKDCFLRTLMF